MPLTTGTKVPLLCWLLTEWNSSMAFSGGRGSLQQYTSAVFLQVFFFLYFWLDLNIHGYWCSPGALVQATSGRKRCATISWYTQAWNRGCAWNKHITGGENYGWIPFIRNVLANGRSNLATMLLDWLTVDWLGTPRRDCLLSEKGISIYVNHKL